MTDDTSTLRTEALNAARAAKFAGLSQNDIAKGVGANQSQVSRILAGKSLRRSKLFDEICIFAYDASRSRTRPNAASNSELIAAVDAVWDGSHQHAKALATVIRSLGALGAAALPDAVGPAANRLKSSG